MSFFIIIKELRLIHARIKVDSYGSLPLEKTLTFHNVILLINLIFDKNQNKYYHNIF